MSKIKNPNNSRYLQFFILFVVVILIIFIGGFHANRIVQFSVNHFTDYNLSYDSWRGCVFGRSVIKNGHFVIKEKGLTISAEKTDLDFNAVRFFKKRQLLLTVDIQKMSIALGKSKEGKELFVTGNILALSLDKSPKCDKALFTVYLDKNELKIIDIKVRSKDMKIDGYFKRSKKKDVVDVDIKISFSPGFAETFDQNVRDNMLAPDDNGWYGTVISYRGNPVILKALYSLTSS